MSNLVLKLIYPTNLQQIIETVAMAAPFSELIVKFCEIMK